MRVPCSAPHGPIELSDGRLMYVGAELSRKQIERKGDIVAVESRDQGKTWDYDKETHVDRVNFSS